MAGLVDSARAFAQRLFGLGRKPEPPPRANPNRPRKIEPPVQAMGHILRGLQACKLKSYALAYEAFFSAFILYIQMDDRRSASLVQKTIALVLPLMDNPSKARMALANALRMLQQAGLRDEEARALFMLGDYEAKQRAFKDAYAYYEESLKVSREISYPAGEVECLCRYARALAWHGRIKETQRRLDEAAAAADASGDASLVGMVAAWRKKLEDNRSYSLSGVGSRRVG